jgi:hypothetical protein
MNEFKKNYKNYISRYNKIIDDIDHYIIYINHIKKELKEHENSIYKERQDITSKIISDINFTDITHILNSEDNMRNNNVINKINDLYIDCDLLLIQLRQSKIRLLELREKCILIMDTYNNYQGTKHKLKFKELFKIFNSNIKQGETCETIPNLHSELNMNTIQNIKIKLYNIIGINHKLYSIINDSENHGYNDSENYNKYDIDMNSFSLSTSFIPLNEIVE